MRYKRTAYRGFEAILATIGGIIALIASTMAIFSGNFTELLTLSVGTVSIAGSIIGILAGWYSFKDEKIAGVVLIISSILALLGPSTFGMLGAILILIAGIMDLFRN